jgi:hypothetical protein
MVFGIHYISYIMIPCRQDRLEWSTISEDDAIPGLWQLLPGFVAQPVARCWFIDLYASEPSKEHIAKWSMNPHYVNLFSLRLNFLIKRTKIKTHLASNYEATSQLSERMKVPWEKTEQRHRISGQ